MKKTLQQLTIKDNFMFAAVMSMEDNCKKLLEMILNIEIERVEVDKEKSLIYHPQYKGVRLDVYAKDENNTRYNVEMQARSEGDLAKRARYYRSQIDMDMLLAGYEYSELPNSYVIFICDFDPFDKERYLYSFENRCEQDAFLSLQDGGKIIFLSTAGKNEEEVPEKLVRFLKFVKADAEESALTYDDEYITKLQKSVKDIKLSREMEASYMYLELLIKDEHKKAKIETILELLEELGELPKEVEDRIRKERNKDHLKAWNKLAANSTSIEEFIARM